MHRAERRTTELLSRPATVRALLEGAAEAFMAVGQDGRIVLVNRMTEDMFGYTRQDLIGQPFGKVVPENRRAEYSAKWPECFRTLGTREPGTAYESAGLKKNGTEFPIEVRLSVIKTELGPLAFTFITDATPRRRSEDAQRRSQQQLRALAGRLISAGEETRRQLARDLHDIFSQRLALLSMEVSALEQEARGSAADIAESLKALSEQIVRLASDVHHLSRQIHPSILTDLGLTAALESECFAFSRLHGTPAVLDLGAIPPLAEEVSVALYRIAQEALRNASKHARADEIRLSLRARNGEIVLKVEDNGVGFDPGAYRKGGGLGLVSIRERARLVNGSVKIESRPGRGTSLIVRVPIRTNSDEAARVAG
jgi:PAS domain S-box-containing protein